MKFTRYENNGNVVMIPIPQSYRDVFELIRSDEYRLDGQHKPTWKIILKNLMPFSVPLLFYFRLSQYKGVLYPIAKIIYKWLSIKTSVQIPSSTKVGFGFYIGHKTCIVINHNTIIGNNVNVSQFCNIGSNYDKPAFICDNVYIGPHVSIVESVIVAENATVGAGTVVTKDIPRNATVVGVPNKVINYNDPGRFVNRRYIKN